MSTIIGRKQEMEELERLYRSDRPEFVAVYGRRRVGKTFLIKQALKDRIVFQHTGVSPVDQEGARNRMKTQLESFRKKERSRIGLRRRLMNRWLCLNLNMELVM